MNKLNGPDVPADLLDGLRDIVGAAHVITEHADQVPYTQEQRGLYESVTPAVVRPGSTQEVSRVVRACAAAGVAMIPQGGNTGLVGGTVAAGELVVNLGRMSQVRDIDAANFTMTVDAGLVLADAQTAARDADRLFPLSLGAEGSCQIGGNLATNAGGTAVLRYGSMRDLTLGLEVVLASGEIWDGLRALRKDNTGYDLKQLFIGAEGTLGIITGAVIKLFPHPTATATGFVALRDLAAGLELLGAARARSGDTVTALELMTRNALEMTIAHMPGIDDPLAETHDYYALIEMAGSDAGAALEEVLAGALEGGQIRDAVVAQSTDQRARLWRIREGIVEAQGMAGASIKNDVAVPIAAVPEFMARAGAAVEAAAPGVRIIAFGHLGDGNIHFNLSQPEGGDAAAFLARWSELTGLVFDVVEDLGGSFSAEHGIGINKRADLVRRRSPVELDLMATVKRALDPDGLMNPGKILA